MALAREWDELVEQVRALEGFEDFLRPPPLKSLLPAADGGPVVILNISRWRCDALIVKTSGVEVVELPDLRQEDVAAQAQAYLEAVGARQGDTLRGSFTRDADVTVSGNTVEAALDRCLRWMWDAFAAKVLAHLGYTGTPSGAWPRIWWCPTGPLALLPIHAAGDHSTAGEAVLDRVVSSYTPTLRALVQARGDAGEPHGDSERMLFVGMPQTPNQADLPKVRSEEQFITQLFAGRCTSLVGSQATRDTVMSGLREHGWVHFACHGEQNLADPSQGGLLVQDGTLTVTDLSSQQYRGDFAYLSGCKTAVGGANLPDEAITLAAALHYTGYRHVIATLWSIWDDEAAQIAKEVYEAVAHGGVLRADLAAEALHHAVRRLRDRHRDRPSVWTPFAHTGP
ncbi:hypothetical protein CS0771_64910 [Catellatospora sp. IY07-71]|nr:hypothetical protein CS0771_64910 [Catellatospora sp. IY07-71]